MLKRLLFTTTLLALAFVSISAQTTPNSDTVMVLPFENTSSETQFRNKPEFNWVGESFADSLADLLNTKEVKATRLNVISNRERKIIQEGLGVPLTTLPSLATSIVIAKKSKATLLVSGNFSVYGTETEKDKVVPTVLAKVKLINVDNASYVYETDEKGNAILNKDNKIEVKEIVISGALTDLPSIQGEIVYQILYLRDKNALPFPLNKFKEMANKVPSRAFEAFIKGLLTSETDFQTRENYLKNAMRIYAEDEKTKGGIYADAALELGHFYLTQRKFPEAIDYFSRIPQETGQYAEAAFYTSLIHWQQGNYEQALAVLGPLADDLKLTSVYNTLGSISVQASRIDKKNKGNADKMLRDGIDFLKRAVDASPDDSRVRFNYAFALFLNNNYAETVTQLLSIVEKNQKDGEIYFLLAKAFEKLGDSVKAADADDKAKRFLTADNKYAKLEVDWKNSKIDNIGLRVEQPARKDFVSVILRKNQITTEQKTVDKTEEQILQAQKFYKDGRDDEALDILRYIISREPMNAEAFFLSGMINLRRGNLDEAIAKLRTALFWNNNLIDAYISLGKIYIQKNDCLQAKTYAVSAAEEVKELDKNMLSAVDIEKKNQEVAGLQRLVERCSTK